jgi:modulator of FtsH protease
MTAYDFAAWTDFANTVAGGAAALAGLLFVGLSLNLSEVLKYPGVPARAVATLGLTVAVLLTAIFVATPGRTIERLPAEIALTGVATAAMVIVGVWQQRSGSHPARALSSMLFLLVPALMLIAGAVSLWMQRGGGLYWVTAAVVTGFRVRDGQRMGLAGRDQALGFRACVRRATTTMSATTPEASTPIRISPVMSPWLRVRWMTCWEGVSDAAGSNT